MSTKHLRALAMVAIVIAMSAALCCGCSYTNSHSSSTLQIRLDVPTSNPESAFVEVDGIGADDLARLREAALSDNTWTALLRVSVKGQQDGEPAMLGSYAVQSDALRFTPRFPFDAGRQYSVTFDPSKLPSADAAYRGWMPVVSVVSRPKPDLGSSTEVAAIYPSGEIVPQNQLRLYIQFTAPMSYRNGVEYIHLLDEAGTEVDGALLPLDTDLWNQNRTRCTLFFDPGRVKRGLLPRREMGPPLRAGREYTLAIDSAWPDAQGLPLKRDFRRSFRVGPPIERPLDPAAWRITLPKPDTRDPLVVTFNEPLDRALLMRALGIENGLGKIVEGEIGIEAGETRWLFSPREPWAVGDYQLVALSILEDVAGNRIGRAFEVMPSQDTDRTHGLERTTIPFRIGRSLERWSSL